MTADQELKIEKLEARLDTFNAHLHRLDQAITAACVALNATGVPEVEAGRVLTIAERIERLAARVGGGADTPEATKVQTSLYPFDRIDEAAAELKASVAGIGLAVNTLGWDIIDGDQRFAHADTLGCADLDRVVAHAKREIIMSRRALAGLGAHRFSDAAQIRFRASGEEGQPVGDGVGVGR